MNRTLSFVLAMAFATPSLLVAQATSGAPVAAPAAAAPAAVPPQALPAKIAIIDVQAVIVNTNEGQRAFGEINKKYEPQNITQAVVNAYNASSGVAAPPPSAPSPTRRTTPAPGATTTPRRP